MTERGSLGKELKLISCFGLPNSVQKPLSMSYPRWTSPVLGSFKLYTDGSHLGNPGKAASNSLIRDGNGRWVAGCCHFVESATSILAELWGLCDGLQLEVDRDLSPICIEMDARIVVDIVNKGLHTTHPLFAIVNDCRELLKILGVHDVHHIFRKDNQREDALARKGLELDSPDDFCVF